MELLKNILVIEHLSVDYTENGKRTQVLRDINLSCREKEIVAIVGKSGSGKTTLLRAVAGLTPASAGSIYLRESRVENPARERGLVFQQYCVFPWLSVRGNIELGSRCGTDTRVETVRQEVESLIEAIGMRDAQHKWASQLSGGMQQRVAIARALAADPELLLLDEPFGALDPITRLQMQQLIKTLFESMKQGILFVTHDIHEAVLLADKIALLAGSPSTVSKTWQVPTPRCGSSPLGLSKQQQQLTARIYEALYANHEATGSH